MFDRFFEWGMFITIILVVLCLMVGLSLIVLLGGGFVLKEFVDFFSWDAPPIDFEMSFLGGLIKKVFGGGGNRSSSSQSSNATTNTTSNQYTTLTDTASADIGDSSTAVLTGAASSIGGHLINYSTDRGAVAGGLTLANSALDYGQEALKGSLVATDRDRERTADLLSDTYAGALQATDRAGERTAGVVSDALAYGNNALDSATDLIGGLFTSTDRDRARANDLATRALDTSALFADNIASHAFKTIEGAQQATANTVDLLADTTSRALDTAAAAQQSDSTELGKVMLLVAGGVIAAYVVFK